LASEGCRELIRHGFADLDLPRILGQTVVANVASRATMASVGTREVRMFHEDGEDTLPKGSRGQVGYEIRRADWAASRPRTSGAVDRRAGVTAR
jgi:RimJ/RimL family protein N-acetyltransferase